VIWGDGTQVRDNVYIDDIVDAAINATRAQVPVVNVGSGRTCSYNQLVDEINKVLGTDIKPTYVSKPANYVDVASADITLMKESLQIEPISLEEGLTKFYGHLQKIVINDKV